MATGFEKYPEFYGSTRWRKLRLEIFVRDGYRCAMCKRLTTRPHCDHKKPHKGNEGLFWDEGNLSTLCSSCHNTRKAMIDSHGYSQACAEDGQPLDPGHPWRKGKQ